MNCTCTICHQIIDPSAHIAIACGHTYHRLCIQQWVATPHQQYCPQCRAPAYFHQISRPIIFDAGLDNSMMEDGSPNTPRHLNHQLWIEKRQIEQELIAKRLHAENSKKIEDEQQLEIEELKKELVRLEEDAQRKNARNQIMQIKLNDLDEEQNLHHNRRARLGQMRNILANVPPLSAEDQVAMDRLGRLEHKKAALEAEGKRLEEQSDAVDCQLTTRQVDRRTLAAAAQSRLTSNNQPSTSAANPTNNNNRGGRGGRGGSQSSAAIPKTKK